MSHNLFSLAEFSSLSKEQKQIIQEIEKGSNVLITGGAGTGKSFLLNYLKRHYSQNGLAVTASTGIAAVNIGGSTIHSWSGIGLANLPLDQIISNLFSAKFSRVRKRIKQTNILAIDEISMISASLFEIIDQVLRAIRENDKPFGGLQILLFGDFLQLPPVTKYGEESQKFCFNSIFWPELKLKNFVLKEVFRQKDKNFIKILNNLRFGIVDKDDVKILEERMRIVDKQQAIKPTILTTHNNKVAQINEIELKKIPNQERQFEANYFGANDKIELLRKNCLASESLKLKVGAQVMMIKNTYQKDGIINGSLGIIKDFSGGKFYPIVEFANGISITISPEEWLIERFDTEKREMIVDAGVKQIPLILAWAITIHKSQGLTLDKIFCDLSEVFSPGQAYVALSRARNLSGVFIGSINFNRINADQEAVNFYKSLTLECPD